MFIRYVLKSIFSLFFFFLTIGTVSAAIDVNVSFSPGTIYPNQTAELTYSLQNSSLNPVLNTVLSDTLPENIFIASPINIVNNCSGTVNAMNSWTGWMVSLTWGTIPAGDGTNPWVCTITVDVIATQAGSFVNTVEIWDVSGEVLWVPESNAQISQGTVVSIIEDITINHQMHIGSTSGPIWTPQGDETAYLTIQIQNPNPTYFTETEMNFNLSSLIDVVPASWSTTCAWWNIDVNGIAVSFSGWTIPAWSGATNGVCELIIGVQNARDITLPYARTRWNFNIPADTINTKEGATNSSNFTRRYDMYTGIYVDRTYLNASDSRNPEFDINDTDTIQMRMYWRNYNTQDISPFSFTDILPAGMRVVSIETDTCWWNPTINASWYLEISWVTFDGVAENLAWNQTSNCDLRYTVEVDSAGSYDTSIPAWTVWWYQFALDSSSLTVTNDLFSVAMAISRAQIYQGDTALVTLTLSNRSNSKDVTHIQILNDLATMGLDNGAAWDTDPLFKVSSRNASPFTTCPAGILTAIDGATSINFSWWIVPANSSCVVSYEIKADTDAISNGQSFNNNGYHYNTIPVWNITYEVDNTPTTYNVEIEERTRVARSVRIYKDWLPRTIGSGGISRLQLRIDKVSLDRLPYNNMSLLDNLPTWFEVAANPDVLNECGGTFSANPGDTSVSLSGGHLAWWGATTTRCYIYVNIKAPELTPGNTNESHRNRIPGDTHGNPVYFSAVDDDGNRWENQYYAAQRDLVIENISLSTNTEFLTLSINGWSASRVRTTISNISANAIDLTNVSLTDVLPGTVELFSNINPAFTDTSGSNTGNCRGGVFSGNAGSNSISLSWAEIDAGATCYFEFNVTALSWGNHINTIAIGDITSDEGVSNNNAVAATLTVGRQVNVGKWFSPKVIELGTTSTLRIDIFNTQAAWNDEVWTSVTGSGARAALIDTLPVWMNIVWIPTTTCSGGVVTTWVDGWWQAYIELNGWDFLAESKCSIIATVEVSSWVGIYTNSIAKDTLWTVSGSQNPDNASADLIVIEKPTITKLYNPTSIASGVSAEMRYTLTNPNSGAILPGWITGVTFSDTLSNVEIASPLVVWGTCNDVLFNASVWSNQFSVTDATIPAWWTCTITIRVTSFTAGDHSSAATWLHSDQTQTVGTGSNIATLGVLVPATILKVFSGSIIDEWEISRLTYTFTNPNNYGVNNISFHDIFPAGIKVASNPNVSETCISNHGLYDYVTNIALAGGESSVRANAVLDIPANSSCDISLDVVWESAGTYSFTSSNLTTTSGTSATGATASITINVGNTPPTLVLNGSGSTTHEVNTNYIDQGARANDNEDDDTILTGNITLSGSVNHTQLWTYILEYNVVDSWGLSASGIIRTIHVVDTTAPVINYGNARTISARVGTQPQLITASCNDNYDSICTVTQSGSININIPGNYVISYTATDTSGNTSQETVTVTILANSWSSWGYDKCWPLWDLSGDSYDGICDAPEEEEKEEEKVIPEEKTWEEEKVVEPEVIVEPKPEPEIEKEEEKEKTAPNNAVYTVKNDFSWCEIIDNINDENFMFQEAWVFVDENELWYKDKILKFAEIWIVDGYEDGRFKPKKRMTRAEFLKVALISHCYKYKNEDTSDLKYKDVDKESWQAKVIKKSEALWMIHGDIVTINKDLIDVSISEESSKDSIEHLKFIFVWLGLYNGEVNSNYDRDFTDAVLNFQLSNGVIISENDVWAGYWGPKTRNTFFEIYNEEKYDVFRPNTEITKAEAVKILMRISYIYANKPVDLWYKDVTTSWHEPYVRTGETIGLFDSKKDDFTFSPQSYVERQDMIDLIDRLVHFYR